MALYGYQAMKWKSTCSLTLLIFCIATAAADTAVFESANRAVTTLALHDSRSSGLYQLRESMAEFGPDLLISKPTIRELLSPDAQKEQTHVKLTGPDSQTRPVAVTFQRAFEQSIIKMLHKGKIKSATAIIHTDRPATPLCNHNGQIIEDSLPDSIREDPQRLKTLKDRTETMRLLAREKKIDLYVTYAHGGLQKRSGKEQSIFKEEIRNRRNISLHNVELSCSAIPKKLSGATYVLKLANGDNLFFLPDRKSGAGCR